MSSVEKSRKINNRGGEGGDSRVDMLNFNFSEKGLGLVYPSHFLCDFPRKMFLMLHSIN